MIRETQGKKLAKREQDDDAEHSLLPKLGHAVVVLRERVHARHRGCSALAEAARTFPAGPFTGARVQPSGRSHNEDSRSRYYRSMALIACPRGTHNHTKAKENVMQLMLPMMHGRLLLPCMQ